MLFGKKDATSTTSGTDVLREATRIRIKKGHAAPIARDLGIGTAALEEFSQGNGTLPVAVLNALAKYLLGDNVTFDAERNLLKRTGPEATSVGFVQRTPFKPTTPPPRGPTGWPPIVSVTPEPEPQPKGRPGWAE